MKGEIYFIDSKEIKNKKKKNIAHSKERVI
jgi:hypothetical protein